MTRALQYLLVRAVDNFTLWAKTIFSMEGTKWLGDMKRSIGDINEHLTRIDETNGKLYADLHDITYNILETMLEDPGHDEELKGLVDKFKSNAITSKEAGKLLKMLYGKRGQSLLAGETAKAYLMCLAIAEVGLRLKELEEAELVDP